MTDPHTILNISPGASNYQIKNAYRQLAKKYHPDVSKAPDAAEMFIAITEAYEILTNGTTEYEAIHEAFTSAPENKSREAAEQERQARARRHAQKKYEEFIRNNTEFKQKWYYFPAKIMSYSFVYGMYLFGISIIVIPLAVWAYSPDHDSILIPFFTAMFGLLWIRMTKVLKKEIDPFFDEHQPVG